MTKEPIWNHNTVHTNGVKIHFVRHGDGFPLLLIHGWPEFWRIWRKNIIPLSENFDVIVPDLRGYGDSDSPDMPVQDGYTIDHYVGDLSGLLDILNIDSCGIVTHDVGAHITQAFVRKFPHRVKGLFFFDCPYPGIGERWAAPEHLNEIWYQSFNQLPWAADLVGSNRHNCELYFRHFLSHWAYDPDIFDQEDLDLWVENFLKPGNLQGGFNWYISLNPARIELIRNGPPELPKIDCPVRVMWGVSDKIIRIEWADRLGDYFSDLSFEPVERAGHYPQYERPELINTEIKKFFSRFS